jgi:hypothetical protein
MSAFEYLSVFISIILGLAIVHLLGGVSLILDRRVTARLYWVHMVWVINMFSLITWIWWGNWQLNGIESFSPAHYIAMVLFSVVVWFFYLGEALLVAAVLKGHVDRQVLSEPNTLERTIMFITLALLFGSL